MKSVQIYSRRFVHYFCILLFTNVNNWDIIDNVKFIKLNEVFAMIYDNPDELEFLESMINHLRQNTDMTDDDRLDLADYLFEMLNSNVREMQSRLSQIICHMLKLKYQPNHATRSWVSSITFQSIEISNLIKSSPSLKIRLADSLPDIYSDGLKLAISETGLSKSVFPQNSPWSFDDLLNPEFVEAYVDECTKCVTTPPHF